MLKITLLVLALAPCYALAADPSPYAGEEQRSIKSLSRQEIESLRSGDGMGFAKLAELNHFPGPKHVLDITDELGLTSEQVQATTRLYEDMLQSAVALGEKLLLAEAQLDQEFERGSIRAESLETALLDIARLRAQLRYVHLQAHLRQRHLLSSEQIEIYDRVRGYQSATHKHADHSNTHD